MVRQFASSDAVMERALELARRGLGAVEPNPAVGAVIVDDDLRCLGEGWHQRFGGPHAEVHALAAAGASARGATLYVTLEPCCHFGKTPPCSQAVIAAGIRRVVVAMADPAAHVGGRGIAELKAAGVEVSVGLCEAAARRLTAPFVCGQLYQRPWVHLKWAMTLDGKLSTRTGHSQWITSAESRAVVHQLRGRMDAVIVGLGTALADDPLLTARPVGPRTALRIVLDSQARLPLTSHLVQTARETPVLVATTRAISEPICQSLLSAGVEVLTLPAESSGRTDVRTLISELGRRRLTNVLVEGGSAVHGAFHDADLMDEVHAFIAPKITGGRQSPSPMGGTGLAEIPPGATLIDPVTRTLGPDLYVNGITWIPGDAT